MNTPDLIKDWQTRQRSVPDIGYIAPALWPRLTNRPPSGSPKGAKHLSPGQRPGKDHQAAKHQAKPRNASESAPSILDPKSSILTTRHPSPVTRHTDTLILIGFFAGMYIAVMHVVPFLARHF